MRTSSEHLSWPASPAPYAGHIAVSSVLERNPGMDETLGRLFIDMRAALRMTPAELALRLGTQPQVIANLEAGRLRALPPWQETVTLVTRMAGLLRVDPQPILHRISRQMGVEVAMPAPAPATAPAVPPVSQPPRAAAKRPQPAVDESGAAPDDEAQQRRRRRRNRTLLAVAAPMMLVASSVWVVQKQPRFVSASLSLLPRVIARPIKAELDQLTLRWAPRRDGLRWVEVDDPRSRKSDKLRTTAR